MITKSRYVRDHKKLKSIFFYAGFYTSNFDTFFKANVNNEGIAEFTLPVKPNTLIPLVDIQDSGHIVLEVLQNPSKYVGQRILVAGEYLTYPQIVETYKRGILDDKSRYYGDQCRHRQLQC
jgi:hypothetical protein